MKRIFAMVVVWSVSVLIGGRLDAQACHVNLGTYSPQNSLRTIAVDGSIGAMYDVQRREIVLLDLTNPAKPVARDGIAQPVLDIAIGGQMLYAVNGSGTVWVYNIADLSDPILAGSLLEGGTLDRVDVSGTIAVVRDTTLKTLVFYDIADPSEITRIGAARVTTETTDIALLGTRLYVTDGSEAIRTYSLERLDRITQIGLDRFPGSAFSRIDADGKFLFAQDTALRMATLFDTTGVLTPVGSNPYVLLYSLALSGCTEYLASSSVGIFDISGCANGLCSAAANSLSLLGGRFAIRADWADATGRTGIAHAVRLTDSAGYFWFFDQANAEVHVKMLDACVAPFNRFWFFGAGLTNVEVKLEVTDKQSGRIFRYTNPQGTPFAPIQDTSAIDVCP